MKKILFVFGTRPEAIKLAPVINIFKQESIKYKTLVAVTAQHREMLDQVLEVFQIIPDYDLDLMATNQTLESLTGKILNGISDLLNKIKPDLVFVQGDTTTTFSVSLAAFYQKITVGHIEAGLRTNNKYSPFPEEMNRRIATQIASYHFPPTKEAKKNLLKEGIKEEKILVSGNTVIDALLSVSANIDKKLHKYEKFYLNTYNIDLKAKRIVLVTGHRRESFGEGFENICYAIKHIALNNNINIIYPVHLNPNVQDPVNRILEGLKNVYLIPPQDYVPFVFLMKQSHIILTDSGGVQEEGPSLEKPILVMRSNTERPEGVVSGTAKLVGNGSAKIIAATELLLNNQDKYEAMSCAGNPYGDGKASENILHYINQNLS